MKVKNEYQQWFDTVEITDKSELDHLAAQATTSAYQKIDCLECAKCCLTTVTTFTESDIQSAAKSLAMSSKNFKKQYLFMDLDGNYTTQNVPCPFLDLDDHKCKIYDNRPHACRSFPHTHKDHFLTRKRVHIENAKFCGITTYVLDTLKTNFTKTR
ncbi:MAG TPA: YkgJ family cysteine cluster protein [Saprospiraceae bacterium]|nr:YkgJ family cysteine cluster protein [Saprospiraceae bacterium]